MCTPIYIFVIVKRINPHTHTHTLAFLAANICSKNNKQTNKQTVITIKIVSIFNVINHMCVLFLESEQRSKSISKLCYSHSPNLFFLSCLFFVYTRFIIRFHYCVCVCMRKFVFKLHSKVEFHVRMLDWSF